MSKSKHQLGPGLCNLCSRNERTKNICIPGYGPERPELICIAESPSTTEDLWCRDDQKVGSASCRRQGHTIGQPLVGKSGQLLRRALVEAGVDPSKVYYTNAVRCSGGTPTLAEARKCSIYIHEELSKMDYSECWGVLLLGEFALRAFTDDGRAKISEARLKRLDEVGPEAEIAPKKPSRRASKAPKIDDQELGNGEIATPPKKLVPVPLFASFHPAACLPGRDPSKYEELVSDIVNMRKTRHRLRDVVQAETSRDLGKIFRAGNILALDLEWKTDGTIRMAGISDGRTNAVVSGKIQELLDFLQT